MTIKAAGILFLTPDNKALFLQRAAGRDFPAYWGLPGGELEGDETLEAAAIREAKEECDFDGGEGFTLEHLARTKTAIPDDEVDFTTFVHKGIECFTPELNGEHTGYAWVPFNQPPEPLHPGVALVVRRVGMDELEIARAMVAGELPSPQQYKNLSLFALRITGTGLAFRAKHDEWVWRKPEVYLNEDFLQRSNGLPVIWVHPPDAILDSKEFGDRVIGSIMLPYIQGDEVWGIAKILDETAAKWMTENQLSTSPGVMLGNPSSPDVRLKDDDGRTILIEGKPALLDHLAVCCITEGPDGEPEAVLGVWDRNDGPKGVKLDSQKIIRRRKKSKSFERLDSSVKFIKMSESVAKLRHRPNG